MSELLKQTPSQTVGPFFAYGLVPEQYGYAFTSAYSPVLAQPHTAGEHIELVGQVLDGAGAVIPDAVIEIQQLDSQGREITSLDMIKETGFTGYGRCGSGYDQYQHFLFKTVKPGAEAGHAPVINVIVMMRGMLLHAFTKVYFSDEAEANAKDPVLSAVPEDRRATLIAKRENLPGGVRYRFDIHMQGPKETAFFDL